MTKLMAAVRARLVDDWRQAGRWWSVRLNALGALLLPLLTMVPSMPAEVQEALPPALRAVLVALWCLAAIAVRVWAQKPKDGGNG
jgi:hypothetical protein